MDGLPEQVEAGTRKGERAGWPRRMRWVCGLGWMSARRSTTPRSSTTSCLMGLLDRAAEHGTPQIGDRPDRPVPGCVCGLPSLRRGDSRPVPAFGQSPARQPSAARSAPTIGRRGGPRTPGGSDTVVLGRLGECSLVAALPFPPAGCCGSTQRRPPCSTSGRRPSGRSRFDDPRGGFSVRYAASTPPRLPGRGHVPVPRLP